MLKRMIGSSAHSFYYRSPVSLQHAFTSLHGYRLKRERYSRHYHKALRRYMRGDFDKRRMLVDFMHHLKENIPAYGEIEVDERNIFRSFRALPMTTKEDLRTGLEERSCKAGKLRLSRTSGTTGQNLITYDSEYDRADRMAYLDYIKLLNGVKPFSKRASFTGQELTPREHRNILWRYNMTMNQMLYASCHMTPDNVHHVYGNLARFRPVSLDGYPSSIHMVAKHILSNNLMVDWDVKAVFPNAETLLPHVKEDIEKAFETKVIDQYASAEGAPFIYSTDDDKYEIGHETGLIEFERVGNRIYEMVVTSFVNHATPIVRYRIGDQVEIHSSRRYLNSYTDDVKIKRIIGRQSDYLMGDGGNRITNVNISWVADGFEEKVIQMQFVQKAADRFIVNIVAEDDFDKRDEKVLRDRLARRLGQNNQFLFNYMDTIPKEKSGKLRFIINEVGDAG